MKWAAQDVTSTLQSLLDDLRYKGDDGLSLRTRKTNAAAAFDPLAATVRAGGAVDQNAFADAAKSYLDIERQLYGSTSKYFDKLADITAGKAITNAGGTIQGGPIVSNDNAAAVSAANDNAAAAAHAIYAQTEQLKIPAGSAALFTAAQLTSAVAAANAQSSLLAAPVSTLTQPSNADVVAAIQAQTAEVAAQTDTMRSGFELMIGKLGNSGRPTSAPFGPGFGGRPETLREA